MRTVFPQETESELKRSFFAACSRGYFVEVGANRPQLLSQTFDLEQKGWTGILIEPQPHLADELRRCRSARVFAEACSSRQSSGSRMPLYLAGPLSSFDQKLNVTDLKPHAVIDVPARTLDEILIEARASAPIDFVSIDVEGHEEAVLDGFDLPRWRPRLVLIEDLLIDLRVHQYMRQRGYRCLRRTGINNWYIPKDDLPYLGVDGSWQLFNKLYLGTPFRRMRKNWRRRNAIPKIAAEA